MRPLNILFLVIVSAHCSTMATAQTEVMAWGNLTGIRVEGQLMEFETSFRVVETNWIKITSTGRERQPTKFSRTGAVAKVNSSVQRVSFEQNVEDKAKGTAAISLTYQSDTTRKVEGVYYCFELPSKFYVDKPDERNNEGMITIKNKSLPIAFLVDNNKDRIISARQIIFNAPGREIKIDFSSSVNTFIRKEKGNAILYVQLLGGNLKKGMKGNLHFTIVASGEIDHSPVEVAVDRNKPGRLFEGLGGNFRLQNPTTDPQVIDYCLGNMRVAYGRVEMPWASWDPDEAGDPLTDVRNGKIHERVHRSMQMAQRLAAMGIPVIVGVWFPPDWALDKRNQRPYKPGGVAALRLEQSKTERIYRSMADYLVCLKEKYGVEAHSFSFNESDIGIDVLHTAQEHSDFIKDFGACMASRGLTTKMLLGDNSDATTFNFIVPALNDPATHKYIAAVSFHSWRGCDDATLKKWAGAAQQLNVPLLIGEGSTDAAAWRYPQIFLESTFALYEINLYIRILAICQPISILQWQLTADYSLLWGAGIFGSEGPLRPTQRFWNLRQLSETPEKSFALPVACNRKEVNCAAFGNISRNRYAVHLVNNGAARTATIKGLPEICSDIKVFATNSSLNSQEIRAIKTTNGEISVELPPVSFVTVIAGVTNY